MGINGLRLTYLFGLWTKTAFFIYQMDRNVLQTMHWLR